MLAACNGNIVVMKPKCTNRTANLKKNSHAVRKIYKPTTHARKLIHLNSLLDAVNADSLTYFTENSPFLNL